MKDNFYTFISQIIIANINSLDISDNEKKELLIDITKRLEAK